MKLTDILAALLCVALWGATFSTLKCAMGEMPPFFLSGLRLGIAGLILVGFAKSPRQSIAPILLISITMYSLNFSLLTLGMSEISAGLTSIITELEVPFAALLAVIFLKDRLTKMQLAGFVIAFTGVFFISNNPHYSGHFLYILLILCATLSFAFSNIQLKWMPKIDAVTLIAYASLFAAPQLLLASALFEHHQINSFIHMHPKTAVSFICTTTMGTLAFVIWTQLLKRYSVNQVIPFALLIPVAGVIAGYGLLNETITLKILMGGIITIIGVGLVLLKPTST